MKIKITRSNAPSTWYSWTGDQLRAADLDSGAEVWHQPVRDTVDREPPPP
jgi:hypothetical protein